jgi:branched-chain amino acid transport system substrate-binding protein
MVWGLAFPTGTRLNFQRAPLWRGRLAAGLCVLLSLLLGSCKSQRTTSDPNAPLVIGAYLSMTGPLATFGQTTARGAQMAVDEINAAGGIKGRELQLAVLDDQGKADEAGNTVARLIDVNGASAILGEVASTLSLVGGRIAQRRKVPMVSPSSTNPKVTQVGDYVFRVCFLDPFQGFVMAKFAHQHLKLTRVAIFRDVRNDYSIGLADAFRKAFTRMGGQIVAEESYGAGDTEFSAQLTKLKGQEPEALYVPGYYTDVGAIARQARRLGLTAPMMGGDGWESSELRSIGGKDIVGSYYSNHFAHDNPTPNARRFIAAYQARYHEAPSALGSLGYDSAMVIADAMRRAKSFDPRDIRDALASTANFSASTGSLTLDAERNPVKPAVVVRVTETGDAFEAEIAPEAGFDTDGAKSAASASAHKVEPAPAPKHGSALSKFFQQLVYGLSVGSIYALIALGYTMVYGVLRLINFAHSEVFMIGSFSGMFAAQWLGFDAKHPERFSLGAAALVLLFAMLASALTGVAMERFAYRPLRKAQRLAPLITAIGVSILLQNLGVLVFGPNPRSFPMVVAETRYHIGGVVLTNLKLLIFALSAVLMLSLSFLVRSTFVGKAMRAVSVNMNVAKLMGISVNRIITLTFVLGSVLAAAGGILFGLDQGKIEPLMGVMVGLKAFVAAVLGGIGSIPGAALGGLVIGIAEQLTAGYLSADYRDAITFAILIAVLLVKPEGLFGSGRVEKV